MREVCCCCRARGLASGGAWSGPDRALVNVPVSVASGERSRCNLVVIHKLISWRAGPQSHPGAKAAAGDLAPSLPIARCASRACCLIATDHGLAGGRACLAGLAPPSPRRTLLSNKPLQLPAAVIVT